MVQVPHASSWATAPAFCPDALPCHVAGTAAPVGASSLLQSVETALDGSAYSHWGRTLLPDAGARLALAPKRSSKGWRLEANQGVWLAWQVSRRPRPLGWFGRDMAAAVTHDNYHRGDDGHRSNYCQDYQDNDNRPRHYSSTSTINFTAESAQLSGTFFPQPADNKQTNNFALDGSVARAYPDLPCTRGGESEWVAACVFVAPPFCARSCCPRCWRWHGSYGEQAQRTHRPLILRLGN